MFSSRLKEELIYLPSRMFNERFRIAFTSGSCLGADVDEIPRIVVILAENCLLSVVQEGQEFVKETLLALIRQFPLQAQHAAPKHRAEIIHVLAGRHPVHVNTADGLADRCRCSPESDAVMIWTDHECCSFHAMRVDNTFHDMNMQLPFLFSAPLGAIACLNEVHDNIIVFEGFGKTLSGLLVLTLVEFATFMGAGNVA